MFGSYRSIEELTGNLKDIGCSDTMIKTLLRSDKKGILRHLEEQRTALLEEIHNERSSIGILDQVLYSLRKR